MTFANPLPWWALAFVAVAAALVAWQSYRRLEASANRRAVLSILRFVTLLVLVIVLMRPVANTMDDPGAEAIVPILVDTSRSMGILDTEGRHRIDRAREAVTAELAPALAGRFQVEVLAFGDGVSAVEPGALAATARRSDLRGALASLRDRYRGRTVAGIVVLSDGGDTGAPVAAADTEGPPVYAIGIGSDAGWRDREVLGVTAAEAVLEDSRVDVAASVVSHGHGTAPMEVRLLENGRTIAVRRVTPLADGVPLREVFQVVPKGGAATIYSVQIAGGEGDIVPENDARSVLVQPPAGPRQVLLVEGAPGFEHSFLKRALAGDRGLEIDSSVRKGKNDQGHDTFYIQAARSRADALSSGYPMRREQLFAYDAVILANIQAGQLTRDQLEATRAFVSERGGGLLVLGARSFTSQVLIATPIEDVIPLELSGRGAAVAQAAGPRAMNRVSLTDAGAGHPVMQFAAGPEESRQRWEAVPALASIAPLGGPRPGASVLAVTAGSGGAARALVAVQRYGEGRSMVFTGEASWRWRMMLPASDRSYETFWRQAVRWLALPATGPVATLAPVGASPGDIVPLEVIVRNAAFEAERGARVEVEVTSPDGRIEALPAAAAAGDASGRYEAHFRPVQPGVYRVTARAHGGAGAIGTASASMLVGAADLEMMDPRPSTRVLERVAAESGGRLVEAGDTAALIDALQAGVPAAALAGRRDLWHNGWSFAAIVLLLGAEWVIRRRWGLR